ncbi:hypothetical protein AB0D74_45215 [Streptomyces sp. NPDC048278]|uniref:hypothetical protein n=1 Tax=Streptomyces sp. NPDC048278 TaxID=3155809 RepID=UPI00341838F2
MSTPPVRGPAAPPPPETGVLPLTDHQPLHHLHSHDPTTVPETLAAPAQAAKAPGVPAAPTTLTQKHNGPPPHPLQNPSGEHRPTHRPLTGSRDDRQATDQVTATGHGNLITSRPHTKTPVRTPAQQAATDGPDTHTLTDTRGSVTPSSHEGTVRHPARTGVIPATRKHGSTPRLRQRARKATPAAPHRAATASGESPPPTPARPRPPATAPTPGR